MSAETAYLDSSAFVKLATQEAESAALETYLHEWQRWSSSTLLRTEALRALGRLGPAAIAGARFHLRRVVLVEVDDVILEQAGTVGPPQLRSLDAIHLATARLLGDALGVIITYDRRLAAAAAQLGLPTAAPA
jgi:predicted nucleic acid-binding protein